MQAEQGAIRTALPASQSGLCVFTGRTCKKSVFRGVSRAGRSLGIPVSNQNSGSLPKISARFLGNSRFAESESGDWFDIRLRDRVGDRKAQFKIDVTSVHDLFWKLPVLPTQTAVPAKGLRRSI